jgi:small subunit ribosomal protein S19
MVRSKWKAPFVDYQLLDSIIGNKTRSVIRTKSRSSTILQSFIGLVIAVYTGRMYNNVYIDEKMVGHKLGEFSFTRKLGRIHEKKGKKGKSTKK